MPVASDRVPEVAERESSRPGRLRVVHVLLSLDCGGLERMVLGLVRAGGALGQQVHVVCLDRPGALAHQAESAGARVHCTDKRPGLRPGTYRRLRSLFRDLRPDVVHTHQIGALLYAGPAARRAGVPVTVHTEHGNHLKRMRTWPRRVKARLLWGFASRWAARFYCVSEDIARAVTAGGVSPRRVAVVRNGIDPEVGFDPDELVGIRRSLDIPPDVPVVGTVGRLNEIKRQDLLVRAFALVKSRRPDARLLLVGDGDQKTSLQELAASLGVADAVKFAGFQVRPEPFMQLMDVFALTSRTEGMPMSLLEAWAAGIPVVASRVGGIPELVEDEKTGLLFEFPDVSALAVRLERLLEDKSLARSLGAAGRKRVHDEFDSRATARGYATRYDDLLTGDSRRLPCLLNTAGDVTGRTAHE